MVYGGGGATALPRFDLRISGLAASRVFAGPLALVAFYRPR
jgi:hypothetical protein